MSKLLKTNKVYTTPYGDVYMNFSAKTYGVRVSGGFDSAVMLYMLAQTLTEKNKNATVFPMTIKKWNTTEIEEFDAADSFVYADNVINWVRNKFPTVNIQDSIKRGAEFWWVSNIINGQDRSSYLNTQNMLSSYLNWKNVKQVVLQDPTIDTRTMLYCEYTGTTKNPPVHLTDFPRSAELHREKNKIGAIEKNSPTVKMTADYYCEYEPFRNFDKRLTFWLADNLGILDELLLITRSCEGNKYVTNNFTKECNECWWCQERVWAHKNYKRTELK